MIWVEEPLNKDGIPHFCYTDRVVNLSFAWDGFALEIDVMADDEIVDHIDIPVGYHSAGRNPGRWLAWFQVQCEVYIKEKAYERTVIGSNPDGVLRHGVDSSSGQETPH